MALGEVRVSVGLVDLGYGGINVVFEGLKQEDSMVIVPSTGVESMALGGLTALG